MIPITDSIKSFRRPWVMYTLLVVNIAIFIWQYFIYPSPIELIREYGFIPREFFQKGDFASLITYMFLHGNIGHITGNMLYLYIFGDNVEDVLGHFGFLIAYIFWGVVAAIVQGLTNPTSTIPVIGASGAISGVLGAYMVFFLLPHNHFGVYSSLLRGGNHDPRLVLHRLLVSGPALFRYTIPSLYEYGRGSLLGPRGRIRGRLSYRKSTDENSFHTKGSKHEELVLEGALLLNYIAHKLLDLGLIFPKKHKKGTDIHIGVGQEGEGSIGHLSGHHYQFIPLGVDHLQR